MQTCTCQPIQVQDCTTGRSQPLHELGCAAMRTTSRGRQLPRRTHVLISYPRQERIVLPANHRALTGSPFRRPIGHERNVVPTPVERQRMTNLLQRTYGQRPSCALVVKSDRTWPWAVASVAAMVLVVLLAVAVRL